MMNELDTSQATTQTTTDDSQTVADAVSGTPQSTAEVTAEVTAEPSNWFYADGVPGQGEKPEYFKDDKYKTMADQAKGYKELESKFGSFIGAPEEYEAPKLSDNIKELGITIDPEDPVLEKAKSFAKENNMNQEGFNTLVNLYAETMLIEEKALEELKQQELKALGQSGEIRLQNLNAWASTNLDTELFESFQGLATSADAVKTLERLVSMTRAAPVNPTEATGTPGITPEEVKELQFANDEHGNRKMRNPEYAKMVQQKLNQLHGTENHVEIIGN
jgi:hypothetical protein